MSDTDNDQADYSDDIELLSQEGLTEQTQEIIADNAEELIDYLDEFDQEVQDEILNNL